MLPMRNKGVYMDSYGDLRTARAANTIIGAVDV